MSIDTLRLTAEDARGSSIAATSPRPSCTRPTSMRSRPRTSSASVTNRPAAASRSRSKDVISTHGVETTAGSRILEGYVPVFDATVARVSRRPGCPAREDEHGRVRGVSSTGTAHGDRPATRGPGPRPGRVGRRLGRGRGAGLAPWALGSDTGGSIKQPSALCGNAGLADLRDGVAVRRRRVRVEPRSDRPGGEDRARLRPAVLDHRRSRPARLDDRGVARSGAAGRRGPQRAAVVHELNERTWVEPGVREAVAAIALAEARAEVGVRAAALGQYGLPSLPDLGRRRPTSLAGRRYGAARGAPSFTRWWSARGTRGFGDEPKRRIMLGTYALSAGYYDAY